MSLVFTYNYGAKNSDNELRVWHFVWWLSIILTNELGWEKEKLKTVLCSHTEIKAQIIFYVLNIHKYTLNIIPCWYYNSSKGATLKAKLCILDSYSTAYFVSLKKQYRHSLSPGQLKTLTLHLHPLLSSTKSQIQANLHHPGSQEKHPLGSVTPIVQIFLFKVLSCFEVLDDNFSWYRGIVE